jgi:alkanesulfonate monooxygenase SsuD/methylene tetrahydromethanopterin reductase-like flavin-dependent oxidoreductase (luciferase family)
MRYALGLANGGAGSDARTLAELARLAEASGWDAVFLEDYIVHQGHQDAPTSDPWVALTAMAMATERVLLGTSVTPLSRRRPWKLARETVTLDRLSNGRLILGVGIGDLGDQGFGAVGEATDAKQRAAMLDEALDVLVGLWSGRPFNHSGAHYQVRDLTFLPAPLQSPRIPIWVGGGWPNRGPMLRAARWDGACFYKQSTGGWQDMMPDDVQALRAEIARHRTSTQPFEIELGGRERGADLDRERKHIRAVAEAGATWWSEYVPPSIGGLAAMRQRIASGPVRID